jgi:hypothetical protein
MPLYLFSLSCSSPLFLFFTSSPLHRPYIQPMNLYLFSLPRSSSPSIFKLNLRSYGQLFVLVLKFILVKLIELYILNMFNNLK